MIVNRVSFFPSRHMVTHCRYFDGGYTLQDYKPTSYRYAVLLTFNRDIGMMVFAGLEESGVRNRSSKIVHFNQSWWKVPKTIDKESVRSKCVAEEEYSGPVINPYTAVFHDAVAPVATEGCSTSLNNLTLKGICSSVECLQATFKWACTLIQKCHSGVTLFLWLVFANGRSHSSVTCEWFRTSLAHSLRGGHNRFHRQGAPFQKLLSSAALTAGLFIYISSG